MAKAKKPAGEAAAEPGAAPAPLSKAERAARAEAAAEAASPVASCVARRLRSAKKRLRKIEETEERASTAGKELSEDQLASIAAKPGLLAVIEELERLTTLMKEAAGEEAKLHRQAGHDAAAAEWGKKQERERRAREAAEGAAAAAKAAAEEARAEAQAAAAAAQEQIARLAAAAAQASSKPAEPVPDPMGGVKKILQFLYFAQV
jgi:hypothetical protein